MSKDTGKKSHYGVKTIGGIVGIAVLMAVIICGGVFMSSFFPLPREIFSVVLLIIAMTIGISLALRLGWLTVRDATIFLLTEDHRLFSLDARSISPSGGSLINNINHVINTQTILRQLSSHPTLHMRAEEILKVEKIRENNTYYAIRCQSKRQDRAAVKRTWFLVKGLEDEDLLLRELELRETWENSLESPESRTPFAALASFLVWAGLITLCVLSHPAFGKLPQSIYFPCLGAAFLATFVFLYFVILLRRGQ